ncbi:hypothetical protein CZ774_13045 [Frigoribacterium sp. JB110]|nr:hypothetical protein CZ774_13045 [Frigoribacterium sp. JB110]
MIASTDSSPHRHESISDSVRAQRISADEGGTRSPMGATKEEHHDHCSQAP